MPAGKTKAKKRPSYPSPGRQLFGLYLTVLTILAVDVAVQNGAHMRDPGWVYLLLTVTVTYWSGLRMGMIGIGILLAYLSSVSHIPGSAFQHMPWKERHVEGFAMLLPIVALGLGTIQGKLRNLAIREFDAKQVADEEARLRRESEAEFESRERKWQYVVKSAMDAIIVMARDGTVAMWNPAAEHQFGWTRDEIIGRQVADTIVPPSYREAHREGLRLYLSEGESTIFGRRLELVGMRKDGREFPIELSVVPYRADGEQIFIGFVRDLTEQRKLNERLRQAQKMEAIGTLAAGIAHDFNNILASVGGNLQLAREDLAAGNSANTSMDEVDRAVKRAAYLVRQILAFSSPSEAKTEIIDPREVLSEALSLLRAALPSSMTIESRLAEGLPGILGDATELHQIVLNLGINAHHAMKGSSGVFEVEAISVVLDEMAASSLVKVQPGRHVRITFRDNGVGMDKATVARVFEPFFTTKAPGEGTGLGLSVVYGIVERHGGAISLYSEIGKGTVFHLYFPAVEERVIPVEVAPAVSEQQSGHGERIFYIDDDEALVLMVVRMLSRLRYDVVGFQNPNDALDAFRSDPKAVDLVITDMSMPQAAGTDIARSLREIRPDLPVVLVTGFIRENDAEVARELGITDLILKPNTVQELGQVLHRLLAEHHLQKTAGK